MSKKYNNDEFATGYEARILNDLPKSQADRMKDSRMLANTLRQCLGVTLEQVLDDGSVVNTSVADLLVAKKIKFLLDNPDRIDLKELSSVMGEQKQEVAVSSIPSDAFKGIVPIKKKDDSNSK